MENQTKGEEERRDKHHTDESEPREPSPQNTALIWIIERAAEPLSGETSENMFLFTDRSDGHAGPHQSSSGTLRPS